MQKEVKSQIEGANNKRSKCVKNEHSTQERRECQEKFQYEDFTPSVEIPSCPLLFLNVKEYDGK